MKDTSITSTFIHWCVGYSRWYCRSHRFPSEGPHIWYVPPDDPEGCRNCNPSCCTSPGQPRKIPEKLVCIHRFESGDAVFILSPAARATRTTGLRAQRAHSYLDFSRKGVASRFNGCQVTAAFWVTSTPITLLGQLLKTARKKWYHCYTQICQLFNKNSQKSQIYGKRKWSLQFCKSAMRNYITILWTASNSTSEADNIVILYMALKQTTNFRVELLQNACKQCNEFT